MRFWISDLSSNRLLIRRHIFALVYVVGAVGMKRLLVICKS